MRQRMRARSRSAAVLAAIAGLGAVIAGSGAQASARPSPAGTATHTLTVTATNLSGKPDNNDFLWVYDADSLASFASVGATVFHDGVAKLSVPDLAGTRRGCGGRLDRRDDHPRLPDRALIMNDS